MSDEPVLAVLDDGVGRITLNRPAALNAITLQLARGLRDALRHLAEDADVIVVRGAGGTFCVGGDFPELQRLAAEGQEAVAELFTAFGEACDEVARVPVPVVCAVEGHAMAGGFELLQAADVVLCRDDAKLADNHSNFGQVPGGGGSQRLPRLVGRQRASAHILTGDRLSGLDAVAWGLAYRSAPAEHFEALVEEVVERLRSKSRPAQAKIKRLLRDGLELPLDEGLELERRVVTAHQADEAAAAGFAAFNARGGQPA